MRGEVRLELPADPVSVNRAESAAAALDGLSIEHRAGVQLVVSELVANAVTHAGVRPGGMISVSLLREGGRLRVEVDDGGHFSSSSANPPSSTDPGSCPGLGLKLVGAVCEDWEAHDGRVVAWINVPERGGLRNRAADRRAGRSPAGSVSGQS